MKTKRIEVLLRILRTTINYNAFKRAKQELNELMEKNNN